MIYCFRSFHTEKNVISVRHEEGDGIEGRKMKISLGFLALFGPSAIPLINGGEVKKSLYITSPFRQLCC
jgi:hypothetical protein